MLFQLNEATRNQLINKSKNADKTKAYGTTRYVRRTKQKIASSVKNYNEIDMNALFKGGILSFKVPVRGETNNYEVELLFEHILETLQDQVKKNNNFLEFKVVVKALMNAFNKDDVYISCSCPDWQYRMAFWGTKQRYSSGKAELRPANITNPGDTKGAGCKHSLLVLSNLNWAIKVASVIHNYIKYAKDNMQKAYAEVIFPAVYGVSYDKAVQLGLFDNDELDNTMDNKDTGEIDKINDIQGKSGRFRKDKVVNNQIRFTKDPHKGEDELDLEGN